MGSAGSVPAVYDAPARGITIMFSVLTSTVMAARIVSRYIKKVKFGADDFLIYLSYAFNIALQATCYMNVEDGAVNLPHLAKLRDPKALDRLKWLQVSLGVVYNLAMISLKISVLLLYRRVFTIRSRWFTAGWWINFILIMPCYTVFSFTLLGLQTSGGLTFGRNPLSRYGSLVAGSFNAVTDFLVLLLPMSMVWKLMIPKPEKTALVGIFMFGLVATSISIMRTVRFQLKRDHKWNPAYAFYNDMILTLAESSVGIICACFLVIKPFLHRTRDLAILSLGSLISLASWNRSSRSRGRTSENQSVHSCNISLQGYNGGTEQSIDVYDYHIGTSNAPSTKHIV